MIWLMKETNWYVTMKIRHACCHYENECPVKKAVEATNMRSIDLEVNRELIDAVKDRHEL